MGSLQVHQNADTKYPTLILTTEKYQYLLEYVGPVKEVEDGLAAYLNWHRYNINVTTRYNPSVNLMSGLIRFNPSTGYHFQIHNDALKQVLSSYLLGRHTLILDDNPQLDKTTFNEIITDYLTVVSGDVEDEELSYTAGLPRKSNSADVSVVFDRKYLRDNNGIFQYAGTVVIMAHQDDKQQYLVVVEDQDDPMSSKALCEVLVTSMSGNLNAVIKVIKSHYLRNRNAL